MIIKDLRKQQSNKFGNLRVGDVFTYSNCTYIKIDNYQSAPNVYNVTGKYTETFTSQAEVKYIPSELTLHSPDWEE